MDPLAIIFLGIALLIVLWACRTVIALTVLAILGGLCIGLVFLGIGGFFLGEYIVEKVKKLFSK